MSNILWVTATPRLGNFFALFYSSLTTVQYAKYEVFTFTSSLSFVLPPL